MSQNYNHNKKHSMQFHMLLLKSIKDPFKLIEHFAEKYEKSRNFRLKDLLDKNIITEEKLEYIFNSNSLEENIFEGIYHSIQINDTESILEDNVDLNCLYLSNLSYENKETSLNKLESNHYENSKFLNFDSTQCIMTQKDNKTFIVFRGTESFKDWIVNLRASQKNLMGAKAHRGFAGEIEKALPHIKEFLNNFHNSMDNELVYSGHSLGGALATVLSIYEKPDNLVTFGSPKVTEGVKYRDHFATFRYERYVNESDFVRLVPFSIGNIFEYKHLKKSKILESRTFNPLTSHSTKTYFKTLLEDKLLESSFKEFFMTELFNVQNFDEIKNLYTKEYISLIGKLNNFLDSYKNNNMQTHKVYDEYFKKEFNIPEIEFNTYNEIIAGKRNNVPETIKQDFMLRMHQKHFSDIIDKFKSHLDIYQKTQGIKKDDSGVLDKIFYAASVLGTFISKAILDGDFKTLDTAIKSYQKEKNQIFTVENPKLEVAKINQKNNKILKQ
tara:strand:+ start:4856 stop:6349 length:1494 start_codon:yes stop_codon:yes gene_type:complete